MRSDKFVYNFTCVSTTRFDPTDCSTSSSKPTPSCGRSIIIKVAPIWSHICSITVTIIQTSLSACIRIIFGGWTGDWGLTPNCNSILFHSTCSRIKDVSKFLFGHILQTSFLKDYLDAFHQFYSRSNYQADRRKEWVKTKIDEPYRSQFSVFLFTWKTAYFCKKPCWYCYQQTHQ